MILDVDFYKRGTAYLARDGYHMSPTRLEDMRDLEYERLSDTTGAEETALIEDRLRVLEMLISVTAKR